MSKVNYIELYDHIFRTLWDVTTGAAINARECYRGAKYYGVFLLSEIERYRIAEASGERSIERRGLVAPKSIMSAWAYNILEDCHYHRATPPMELIDAVYYLMGCSHRHPDKRKTDLADHYRELRRRRPNIGVREASRELGVEPSSISRLNKSPVSGVYNSDDGGYNEEFLRIRELTSFYDFVPIGWRIVINEK